ncbi:tail fiber assembly protein [Stenotrophomonas sp. AR029]|uniref:tail fiber assembly protein n=1 Tax=Stenotrophomonas sp. AR029 TaxID=3398601 RepID=UPI0039C7521D
MYAITSNSLRAISEGMALQEGETVVVEVPVALVTSIRGEQMKAERSQRLRATDWTQAPDSPLDPLVKAAWAAYRQQLRDLPAQAGFPDCAWPTAPSTLDGVASVGQPAIAAT